MEKEIEKYLRERVRAIGGRAYKFESPGNNGMPDRMICLPGGRIAFVETKDCGKKLRATQALQHKRLRELGITVYPVIDSKQKVDALITKLRKEKGDEI